MGRVEPVTTRKLPLLAALLVVASFLVATGPLPAQATISRDVFEDCLLDHVNAARSSAGSPRLQMANDLVPRVREWSKWMRQNEFQHMSDSLRQDILPDTWTTWGENIAMHSYQEMPDCDPIHEMWMNSSGHRANILNPGFRFVAIGTYVDSSGWWATQLFFDADGYDANCAGTFCDDDGLVFEPSIEKIAAAGVTHGCNPPTNSLFCPDTRVTRGEMAAFLERAVGLPSGASVEFTDDDNSIFEPAIERIAAAGITLGCDPPHNTRLCPDQYVTRAQMAAFLERALGLPAAQGVDFSDDNSSPFESSIEKIAAAGITLGCNPPDNTRFCPDDYVTRGQMAAFLARALDY